MEHRWIVLAMISFTLAAGQPAAAGSPPIASSELPYYLELRADGVPIVLRVVEGTAGTIESASGVKVALIPKVTDDGVEIHAFDVLAIPGFSGEKAREVEIVKVAVLQTVRFANTKLDLEVRLIRSAVPPVPAGWRLESAASCGNGPSAQRRTSGGPSIAEPWSPDGHQEPLAPCSRCCVTCDGITACWCEVWMSCGHCCCDGPSCGPCGG